MGDFYELFFEDAQVASRELQITLTARDKERSVPMCGVPYHAADNYLSRLLRKGYRVAIYSWNNSLAEFADCLIDALNHRLGCRATATFDRKALKLAGFIEA